MSRRGLLILGAVLALVLAALFWTGRQRESGGRTAPEGLPVGPTERLDRLLVGGPAGTVRLERDDGGAWILTEPVRAEADPRKVASLLDAVRGARIERLLEAVDGGDETFGFDEPDHTIVWRDENGHDSGLLVGNQSPMGTERYVKISDGTLLLVDGSIATVLDVTADELRERRLVPAEATAITALTFEEPSGHAVRVERTESGWDVVEPFLDRGSVNRCETTARDVASLRVVRFAEDGPAESRVSVTAEAGERRWVVHFGGVNTAGEVRTWREGSTVDGFVAAATVQDLTLDPDRYRDPRLVFASLSDILAVTLESEDGTSRLERGDDEAATALTEAVRNLVAIGFLPRGYPFPRPVATVILSGAEGEAGRVEFAPGKTGSWVLARSSWRDGVVFRVDQEDWARVNRLAAAAVDSSEAR